MDQLSSYNVTGDKDGYEWALGEAGAEVIAYRSFGSYQGDWWARVRYQGKDGWIKGSYGSCSGCDAWEHEVGWDDRTRQEWHDFAMKFAAPYLDDIIDQAKAEEMAAEHIAWDMDAKEMLEFVQQHR